MNYRPLKTRNHFTSESTLARRDWHILDNPMNFSWVVEGRVAGSRGPATRLDVEHLRGRGLGALVRMEPGPVAAALHTDVVELGMEDCLEPVQDFTAPTLEQVGRMVSFIQKVLDRGGTVGVSCRAGLGRTGVVLACYLVSTGLDADTAIRRVRRLRPGSIEVISQEEAIREYHRNLPTTGGGKGAQ